jgi:hypothetical protein
MPLERPQIWVPWTDSERAESKEVNQVLTRKWRDRYSALRVRPAVKPLVFDTFTAAAFTTVDNPYPIYTGIPAYADYLLARSQIKLNATSNIQTQAIYRVKVGSNTGSQVIITLDPDAANFTIYDGDVTSNDDVTWFDVTSIVPDPANGPFDTTDWTSLTHLLEVQVYCGANITDVELRTSMRQWTWISADYLPTIPPVWVPSEYS